MVHREDPEGLIVISQPAHAWVSGQLARYWGNAEFGEFAPHEEMCLAAELHDIGFLEWEKAPTLHAESGRPHQFMNLPTRPHLDLWSQGVLHLLAFSRYAALLVSRHVTHLCQNNKLTRHPRDAQAIQGFLDQQQAIQSEVLAELRGDPAYAEGTRPDTIERNTRLIAAWDWMSLQCCMGVAGNLALQVPRAAGTTALELTSAPHNRARVTVRPWPFRTREVLLVCDGRRLPQTFRDEAALRAEMRQAPVVSVQMTLCPEPCRAGA
jgi:hypothetical protein